MGPRALSIRARLTLIFVAGITVVLTFTAVALVSLVHRSLVAQQSARVETAIDQEQARFAVMSTRPTGTIELATDGDVAVQITNLASTRVWASSPNLKGEPVLAVADTARLDNGGYDFRFVPSRTTAATINELSAGRAAPISTPLGDGVIFAFVYGEPISHSLEVLDVALAVSFPLLIVISWFLIWIGLGLALAPVESIRRRMDSIAGADLSQRVPVPAGDDQIARLARSANDMLERLEAASTLEQAFVSNASHELRSPLATLLAVIERARNDPDRADWPAVARRIIDETHRLEGIVSDLFWLARHDEHHREASRGDVDLDDIAYREAARVRSMTALEVDTARVRHTRVTGSRAQLERMVRNAVDNAMRYAATRISFEVRDEGEYALIAVENDGEGVDVATSHRLFGRFTRADDSRSRRSGGSGLGLAIANEIVERHGGRARFVPVDAGTRIEFVVRRDGEPTPAYGESS